MCAATRRAPTKGVVRSLTVVAKGVFRAVGGASAATTKGATWMTVDRCDGTLTRVAKGRVSVVARGRRSTVSAGHKLLVRARLFAARRRPSR